MTDEIHGSIGLTFYNKAGQGAAVRISKKEKYCANYDPDFPMPQMKCPWLFDFDPEKDRFCALLGESTTKEGIYWARVPECLARTQKEEPE